MAMSDSPNKGTPGWKFGYYVLGPLVTLTAVVLSIWGLLILIKSI